MEIEAGSVVGFYQTEEKALAVVRQAAETHGDSAVLSLALSGGTKDEITELIAQGSELLDRARIARIGSHRQFASGQTDSPSQFRPPNRPRSSRAAIVSGLHEATTAARLRRSWSPP
jgi:PPOX class probable F420-dependent enzyme